MTTQPDHISYYQNSLVSWLALSGVSIEISDDSSSWLKQSSSAFEAKPASDTKPALSAQPRIDVAVPTFADLNAFNTYVRGFKEIGLCRTATHAVPGIGTVNPILMVISDAPDAQEDASGQAFSGPGNLLIRKALGLAGFDPAKIYMTYVSKWRPPGQRTLTTTELRQLSGLVMEELRLVQPQAILALGESPLKAILSENMPASVKSGQILNIQNHVLKKETAILSSQKGEFLVKNPTMKKGFWTSIVQFAEAIGHRV